MDDAKRSELEAQFFSSLEGEVEKLDEKRREQALAVMGATIPTLTSPRLLVFSLGGNVDGSEDSIMTFNVGSESAFEIDEGTGNVSIESDSVSFNSDPDSSIRNRYHHLFHVETVVEESSSTESN